jgi:hypothetical protein
MSKKRVLAKDRVGKKFNRLTIIGYETKESSGARISYAVCKCDCGNEITTKMSHVVDGVSKSCGCLKRELERERGKLRRKN